MTSATRIKIFSIDDRNKSSARLKSLAVFVPIIFEKRQEVQAVFCLVLISLALGIAAITFFSCRLSSQISQWEENHYPEHEKENIK